MKRTTSSFLILLFIIVSCQNKSEQANTFDFSAIDPFWEIMDTLSSDLEPSDQLWNELFCTPGYKTLTEIEFPVNWMKSYMQHGVMPSKQQEYNDWVMKGYWDTIFPYHMRQVYNHREEIQAFMKTVNDPDFIDRSLSITRKFWPEGDTLNEVPPIAFLFFNRDARGYDPIIIDLYYAQELYNKGELENIIAHEAHHYFRKQVLSFKYPPEEHSDFRIVHALNQVHQEGIADQIDKVHSLINPLNAKRNERYQRLLKTTPDDIRRLDSLLVIYPQVSDSLKMNIAKQISRSTPNSGHPMGYFMTTTMIKNKSLDFVLEDIGNPYRFFIRYNQAAALSHIILPVFSAEALETISNLEKKYAL